jgi:hypothetical protein
MTSGRVMRALLACALAGVALTLAAAWFCTPRNWPEPNPILVSVTFGAPRTTTCGFEQAWLTAIGARKTMKWDWTSQGVGWSIDAAKPDAPRLFRMRSGFPFLAFQGYFWIEHTGLPPPQVALSSRAVLGGEMPGSRATIHGVPYGVLPIPFLANSGIYAAALFIAWAAHAAFVSRRRKNTNACPSCGYDLSGLPDRPCPECGT